MLAAKGKLKQRSLGKYMIPLHDSYFKDKNVPTEQILVNSLHDNYNFVIKKLFIKSLLLRFIGIHGSK